MEFKAEEIMQTILLVYEILETITEYSATVLGIVRTCWMLYKKVKIYGIKAFRSRDIFRAELSTMKLLIEETEKKVGIRNDGQE